MPFAEDDAEDLRRLERLLRNTLQQGDPAFLQRAGQAEATRILDLACGDCREADMLTGLFGRLGAPESQGAERLVKLTGVDIRAREIAEAADRFRSGRLSDAPGVRREFEFLAGDASKLKGHRQMGEDFDLVFLRHQNFWNGERVWEEIFQEALDKMAPEGRLVITSYFDREHGLALETIRRLGGELITTERNNASRDLVTEGKSVDRHLAVFRRKK
ncbi:MAG: class I SAM-dependent methyltransferase [Verrucomicrobiales bacterium]|nr:class I SAM-dependent methyltransferase [Verrucomicrobiales bacterium]